MAGRAREMIEDRALIHAVAAPSARQAEHFHRAAKARQQLALGVGQANRAMDGGPPAAMLFGAELCQKRLVAQPIVELRGKVEHARLSGSGGSRLKA